MILIVGLGNPGEEYKDTPHNIGFRVLDSFRERYFSNELWRSECKSQVLKGILHDKEVLLQKPLTFMNNSGTAVINVTNAYPIPGGENLWVIHDELDLAWGRVKVIFSRSSAGHKGVESIINAWGDKNFWRFRIGVKPDATPEFKADIDSYLTLQPLGSLRKTWDQMMQDKVSLLIAEFLDKGIRQDDFFFEPL